MLSGPPATLGSPIPVELPRPRTAVQLAHDNDASHFRAHLIATLTAAMGRRKSTRGAGPLGAAALLEVKE